jgi:hypothetical protein
MPLYPSLTRASSSGVGGVVPASASLGANSSDDRPKAAPAAEAKDSLRETCLLMAVSTVYAVLKHQQHETVNRHTTFDAKIFIFNAVE